MSRGWSGSVWKLCCSLALLALPLLVPGCGQAPGGDAPEPGGPSVSSAQQALSLPSSRVVTIALPATVTPQQTVLAASNTLLVEHATEVRRPFAGFGTVTNTGIGPTTISLGAKVGDLWSKGPVVLAPSAVVDGSVKTQATVLQAGATITGGVVATNIASVPDLSTWQITVPATNAGNVTLLWNQQRALAPGAYARVKVSAGASLTLRSGTYYASSFAVDRGGRLLLDKTAGPIFFYVTDSLSTFTFEGTLVDQGGDPGNFMVANLGVLPVELKSAFTGTVVAPNTTLFLHTVPAPGHTGSFFAKDVHVEESTIVTGLAFGGWDTLTSPFCSNPPAVPAPYSVIDFFSMCDNGQLPTLQPPLSVEESIAIRDGFTWAATKPLPNFNADGPTLYYALIYVEGSAELEALDDLQIHWDRLPLFEAERSKWMGQTGLLGSSYDGQGGFVFAVIPGLTYNLLREAALCSDPDRGQMAFRVVQLRDIPEAEARNTDGSLSYTYLATEGFHYRGLPNCPDAEVTADPSDLDAQCDPITNAPSPESDPEVAAALHAELGSGLALACAPDTAGTAIQVQKPFLGLGKRFKRLAKAIVKVVKKVQDLGRKTLAKVARYYKGSAKLTVNLEVRNTDSDFGGRNQQMLRAWGTDRGNPVGLKGVQVRALQKITYSFRLKTPDIDLGGLHIDPIIVKGKGTVPFDALATGTANSSGVATMKVVKSSRTSICVRVSNHAAEVLDWVLPQEACSFDNPVLSADALKGDRTVQAPIQDENVNVLAQITEGHAYLRDVVGYEPKKASVLVGEFAKRASSEDDEGAPRPYAPCFGYPNWQNPYTRILATLGRRVGKIGGDWLEIRIRKGAHLAAEELDQWTDTELRWAEARARAAGTAAAASVLQAHDLTLIARDLAATAKQAAIAAAQAAASATEAATNLDRLTKAGAAAATIAAAENQLRDAIGFARDATATAKSSHDAVQIASTNALNAATAAAAAAVGTAAASAAVTAAGATKVAGELVDAVGPALGDALSHASEIGTAALGVALSFLLTDALDMIFADVDIVMPAGPAKASRGVPTHEYGHVVLCDMMYKASPFKFGSAWTEAITDTVVKQALQEDQTNDADAYINEAFADFFAAQVAGGVNYFGTSDSRNAGKMSWCNTHVAASRCIEDNFGAFGLSAVAPSPSPVIPWLTSEVKQRTNDSSSDPQDNYHRQVSRVASILHDAFDQSPNTPNANVPGNGAVWVTDPVTGVFGNTVSSAPALDDEVVQVKAAALPSVIRNWLALEPPTAHLKLSSFLGGLTKTMSDDGANACDICHLYVLHQPGDSCPGYVCDAAHTYNPVTCQCDVILN